MDMQALETDLRKEAAKLPKELLGILKTLAEKFGSDLERIVKTLDPQLFNHFQAAMVEAAMGTLDKKGLNDVVTKVLREVS